FGELDAHIPMSDVDTIRSKRPDTQIYVYPGANHGFNCDERGSYEAKSAGIAWERSLSFLARHFAAAAKEERSPAPAKSSSPKRKAKAKRKSKKKSKTKPKRKVKHRKTPKKKSKKKKAKKRR